MKNNRLRLLYFGYFCFSVVFIIAVFYFEKESKVEQYLQKKSELVSLQYKAIENQYNQLATNIYDLSINTPEVLDIFKSANSSNTNLQNRTRKELYKKLEQTYRSLQKTNLKQLHFHLPNNYSFLRMHKPQLFGDDLSGVRETVVFVNKYKKPVSSFEEGRIYNGYRYVFPLFLEEKYLGSVELSFSTLAFHEAYKKEFILDSNFLILKEIVDKKVFESEKNHYVPSPFDQFYMEKSVSKKLSSLSYDLKHKPDIQTLQLLQKNIFQGNIETLWNRKTKTLKTFIPVYNEVTKKLVAVYISIDRNDHYIENKLKNFYLFCLIISILLGVIFYYLYINKLAQLKLNKLNLKLRVKADKADKAKIIAQEAVKAKSEFLANMSHEMRTPMNAIIGLTFLTMQSNLNQKQKENLQKLDSAAKHLLGIINDVLDFTKIESGKLSLEHIPFDFNDILNEISNMFTFKIQNKDLELLYDIDPKFPYFFIGDPLRVSQILINIIGNAVKFTEEGNVILKASLLQENNKKARIEFIISDTGIGMSKEQQEKIFSSFSQADSSTTRKYGGSGLGLSICKYLTSVMDGSISVQSIEGVGSTFSITIELEVQQNQKISFDKTKQSLKVMIIDDNANSSNIVSRILKSFGYEVVVHSDGYEALEAIQNEDYIQKSFDLILLDFNMPKINGAKVVQKIQTNLNLKNPPKIVMVTATDLEKVQSELGSSKVAGFVAKPFSASKLYDTIIEIFFEQTKSFVKHKIDQEYEYQKFIPLIQGVKMLLVEDNEQNQEIAQAYLAKANIGIDIANNGLEALKYLEENSYDAILMDCQMPVMDGYEATAKIKQNEKLKSIPIIAMTANAMQGDRQRCIATGMDDYISKPLDINKMFEIISKWVEPKEISHKKEKKAKEFKSEYYDLLDLDVQNALLRMGSDDQIYINQLKRFYLGQKEFVKTLSMQIQRKNTQEIQRQLHTLKGLCGSIGADQLHKDLITYEEHFKQYGDDEKFQQYVNSLFEDFEKLLKNLENFFYKINDKENPDDKQVIQNDELEKIVKDLHHKLESFDTDALELARTLKARVKDDSLTQELKQLIEYSENYDFDEALEVLKTIHEKL